MKYFLLINYFNINLKIYIYNILIISEHISLNNSYIRPTSSFLPGPVRPSKSSLSLLFQYLFLFFFNYVHFFLRNSMMIIYFYLTLLFNHLLLNALFAAGLLRNISFRAIRIHHEPFPSLVAATLRIIR